MAGARNAREEENIEEFVRRRASEQSDRRREGVREAAHYAYGQTTRMGEPLDLRTTDDVLALGTRLLNGRYSGLNSSKAGSTKSSVADERHAQRLSPAIETGLGHEKLAEPDWRTALNRNRYAKAAAGSVGLIAGWLPGASRGAEHIGEGVLEGAIFASRALHPELDYAFNPPGQRAPDQILRAGKAVVDYAGQVTRDPNKLLGDARQFGHQVNIDLNPLATPSADTATDEFRRLYDVGQNQGELALNIAASVAGAEGAQALGAAARTARATRYLSEAGFEDAARYLRKPYKGMGDHSVLPRRLNAPKQLSDNPFFRRTFRHESQGGAYVKHVEGDPYAYGFRLPKGMGARGWSGKKAGVQKLHGLERAWASTPENTKTLLGGIAGAVGGVLHQPADQEHPW